METKRKPQSVYQYEPLVAPSNWNGEERLFVVRLTQLFDQLFARKIGYGGTGGSGKDVVGIMSVEQTTTSLEDGGENVIKVTLTDGSAYQFSVRNGSKGSTPVKGEDYWTISDKEDIVQDVLAVLPVYNGEVTDA